MKRLIKKIANENNTNEQNIDENVSEETKITPQIDEQNVSELKNKGLDEYGNEYRGEDGNVNPYLVFFNDYSDDIVNMEKEEAIEYCLSKMLEINSAYKGMESYSTLDSEEFNQLVSDLNNCRDAVDILFTVKDYLLK